MGDFSRSFLCILYRPTYYANYTTSSSSSVLDRPKDLSLFYVFYLFIFSENPDIWISQWVPLGLEQTFGDEPAIIKAHHTAYNHNKQSFICRTVCW